jgi:hypothetical protein
MELTVVTSTVIVQSLETRVFLKVLLLIVQKKLRVSFNRCVLCEDSD